MPGPRRRARRSRLGSFFFALGTVSVLAATFGAGVFVGRTWPTLAPVLARARESAPRRDVRAERRPTESGPTVTFYQELTAPLAAPGEAATKTPRPNAPPPGAPPRPALAPAVPARDDTAPAPEVPLRRAPARGEPGRPEPGGDPGGTAPVAGPPAAPGVAGTPPAGGGPVAPAAAEPAGPSRFTVQVGAFRERAPAEALRATLAAHGHDAYIAEGDGDGGRFRVRVGSYASREEARSAAARIAVERHAATYVTTR
jgi:cell division protein FtsN